MAGVEQIEYMGEKIYYIDHKGLQEKEVITNQELGKKILMGSGDKEILLITDMGGVYTTSEVDKKMIQINKEILPIVKKAAVLGMTGIKRILIEAFIKLEGGNIKLFDSIEEAKKWLVED